MKKLLLGIVSAIALAASASAADLAARPYVKAPAMIAAAYDWSGFYIDANGGWGSSRKCWDFTTPAGVFVANEGCHDATGGVAGGQIGYRWQTAAWVFGVEGQGDWADLQGRNISLFTPGFDNQSRIGAFGLLTGQVGYAVNNVLFYVKGGAAVTDDRFRSFVIGTNVLAANTVSDTRWGGTVGAGLEYGFTPNWSAKIEYNFMDFGDDTVTFSTIGVPALNLNIDQQVHVVKAGLNYRFTWGP